MCRSGSGHCAPQSTGATSCWEPAEQTLFSRVAVFAGGCTLEAAEAVCNPSGELGLETIDGVATLVDQSLLRQKTDDGESRFGMLETIREYGRDRSKLLAAPIRSATATCVTSESSRKRASTISWAATRHGGWTASSASTTTSGSRSGAPSMTTTSTTVCSSRPPSGDFGTSVAIYARAEPGCSYCLQCNPVLHPPR